MFFVSRTIWLLMFRALRGPFPHLSSLNWSGSFDRAARSVPANVVEGWAKRSSAAEFKRYLQVAIGSCDECKLWLEMSRDEGYLSPAQCDELSNRFNVVGAMLKSLWKQWQTYPK